MSRFNWELFTGETNAELQVLLGKYNIEYYIDHTTEHTYGYKEIATYIDDFSGEPFLRVTWQQEKWSGIDILDFNGEGATVETLTFGEPYVELEDFEVFKNIPDVEDFTVDMEDLSSVLHMEGEDYDEPIKDSKLFPDSEVEPYRQKFFDRQIVALMGELVDLQEEYKKYMEEDEEDG